MAFKMNGNTFPSMLAIAKELGKSRVYRKDFEKFGIVEVDEAPVNENVKPVEPAAEEVEAKEVAVAVAVEDKVEVEEEVEEPNEVEVTTPEPEEASNEEAPEEPKEEEKPKRPRLSDEEKKARKAKRKEEKRLAKEEAKKPTPEMLARAEELRKKVGYSEEIWDWAVDIRKKSDAEVFALAKDLELTWETHESDRINRMRAVMEIRKNLYPGQKRPKIRRSAWKGIPLEEIKNIAKENNVDFVESADERITRMHLIKALKDAGIESPNK